MDVLSSMHIESSEVIQLGKRMFKTVLIALCMLLLILDAKTAATGAVDAIQLCIRVLIPSLFPFFLISILLTDLLVGTSSVLRPLGKLLKIPAGAEPLFLIGMVGGYPVGAQVISQATEKGVLTKRDASRMLQFCNNPGPAFLFGIISPYFPCTMYTWIIWLIIILSAILTAIILPGGSNKTVTIPSVKSLTITQAMEKSIKVMACICGWVVIFRVILVFFERWFLWMLPDVSRILFQIFLELANGSSVLNEINNVSLRFIVSIAGLTIGGLCVLLQTQSVCATLGIRKYIYGKLLQTGIGITMGIPAAFLLKNGISPIILTGILSSFIPTLIILSNYHKKSKTKCRIRVSGSV